jgi:hypothetical protein
MDLETLPNSTEPHVNKCSLRVRKTTLEIRGYQPTEAAKGSESVIIGQNWAVFRSIYVQILRNPKVFGLFCPT